MLSQSIPEHTQASGIINAIPFRYCCIYDFICSSKRGRVCPNVSYTTLEGNVKTVVYSYEQLNVFYVSVYCRV